MGEKLRILDPKWTVRGLGRVIERIEDKETLQRLLDNNFSSVHMTKLGAIITRYFSKFLEGEFDTESVANFENQDKE